MLTAPQRVKFFKLARAAYARESPPVPFDEWRKDEMKSAGCEDSVSRVNHVWEYDSLMLHFATIAMDAGAMGYFTAATERRLRWVLNGLATDLQWLQKTGVDEAYILGIYRQAGMLPEDFADAPAQQLWRVLQILDTRIRRLCERDGIKLHLLPTGAPPYSFRGKTATAYARLVALADKRERIDAGVPPLDVEERSDAIAATPQKVC